MTDESVEPDERPRKIPRRKPQNMTDESVGSFWTTPSVEEDRNIEQASALEDRASRGIQYLQDKGVAYEKKAFDPDEDREFCTIASTQDHEDEVRKGMSRRMPHLMLMYEFAISEHVFVLAKP